MLDRAKVAKEVARLGSRLFPDFTKQAKIAEQAWKEMAANPVFAHKVRSAHVELLMPTWEGALDESKSVRTPDGPYTVVAVDGSQIYPDRHMAGAQCFLVNRGGVVLRYAQRSSMETFTEPEVFLPDDVAVYKLSDSQELVDLMREESELACAVDVSMRVQASDGDAPMCLIDGNIIFWHLEGKEPDVKNAFLTAYLQHLSALAEARIPTAGYVSLTKSRELANLIRFYLCPKMQEGKERCLCREGECPSAAIDKLIDGHVVGFYVPEGHRTGLFQSRSKIVDSYPPHLKPWFFYLNVGKEIARIEVPAWIAGDVGMVDRVAGVAFDQSEKGRGYPVALAEAHEQAVVKGPDREFFYHLIRKVGLEQSKQLLASQKSMKKRFMNI